MGYETQSKFGLDLTTLSKSAICAPVKTSRVEATLPFVSTTTPPFTVSLLCHLEAIKPELGGNS